MPTTVKSIKQPGVTVTQDLGLGVPVITTPVNPAVIVGPAMEVMDVVTEDGTLNDDSKLATYLQENVVIPQSSFPNNHSEDADDLEVDLSTIKVYSKDNTGTLNKLLEGQASFGNMSSFIASPVIMSDDLVASDAAAILGTDTLVIGVDIYVPYNSVAEVNTAFNSPSNFTTVAFAGSYSTVAEVVAAINSALTATNAVAFEVPVDATKSKIAIASKTRGYKASIALDASTPAAISGQTTLKIGYKAVGAVTYNMVVVGPGIRPDDTGAASATKTAILKRFDGTCFMSTTGAPTVWTSYKDDTQLADGDIYRWLSDEVTGHICINAIGNIMESGLYTLNYEFAVGDELFVDGISAGTVIFNNGDRFKLGTLNTARSTFNSDGSVNTAVYDTLTFAVPSSTTGWNPGNITILNKNLSEPVITGVDTSTATLITDAANAAIAGTITAGTAMSYPKTFSNQTVYFNVTIDGVSSNQSTVLNATYASVALLASALTSAFSNLTFVDAGGKLKVTVDTANSTSGVTCGDGSDALGFSLGATNFGTDPSFTAHPIAGTTIALAINKLPGYGEGSWKEITFATNSLPDAVAEINSAFGTTVAEATSADKILITSGLRGNASTVWLRILDDSGTLYTGIPKLWQSVTPSGGVYNFSAFVGPTDIHANPVSEVVYATGTGKPIPDYYLNPATGSPTIRRNMTRSDFAGEPVSFGTAKDIYISYEALRLDLSASAGSPKLLGLGSTTDLDTYLSPISVSNPLALGMYFAMVNAPNRTVYGLGVGDISSAFPDGTPEAYVAAFEFLEAYDVYSVVPLSQEAVIAQYGATHVANMSTPDERGERLLIWSDEFPTHASPNSIQSGECDSTITNALTLDNDPSAALTAAGIADLSAITVAENVYVTLVEDYALKNYNVKAVSGPVVTLNTTFSTTENTDGFFATDDMDTTLVSADYSMSIRGAALVIAGTSVMDKNAVATAANQQGAGHNFRRVIDMFPDTVIATLSAGDVEIPTFYAAAGLAGMISNSVASRPYTNSAIAGFIGTDNSNNLFKRSQLDIVAGGGRFVLMDGGAANNIKIRQQLTTDTSSLTKQEMSATIQLDTLAKLIRSATRNYIGTINISPTVMADLRRIISATLDSAKESLIIKDAVMKNLYQDANREDRLLCDITVSLFYALNQIDFRLSL